MSRGKLSARANWETYEREVVPAFAPPTQLIETRRAFYAGFAAALGIVYELGDDGVTEEQAVAALSALAKECERFTDDVREGRA
jgi:hypothetical protein